MVAGFRFSLDPNFERLRNRDLDFCLSIVLMLKSAFTRDSFRVISVIPRNAPYMRCVGEFCGVIVAESMVHVVIQPSSGTTMGVCDHVEQLSAWHIFARFLALPSSDLLCVCLGFHC